jgi:type IV fimbrial biogenesis protein FimT
MRNTGFTLIELLITLTLLAILLTLAVPVYKELIKNTRTTTQVNQLIAAINFARSEAIKRQAIVTLCASNNQKTCSSDWTKGWLVFVDKQASGQVNNDDEILRIYSTLPINHHLEWHALRNYLQMNSVGGTRSQNGHFSYYTQDKNNQQQISISQTGRIRVETTTSPSP